MQKEYERCSGARNEIVKDLEYRFDEILRSLKPKPTVKGRPKSFQSYFKKLVRLMQKQESRGEVPVITDIVGIRVVCPFIEDLSNAEAALERAFSVTEVDHKGSNFSFKEFGYESTHLLIEIPKEILKRRGPCGTTVAEVQLRTILQDAWAEVEHELVYKAEFTPFDEPMKRKLAAVNASLSLADIVFQEIRDYQRQLNRELGKRRESFFKKIEDSTDRLIFKEEQDQPKVTPLFRLEPSHGGDTIDDMLLDALYAHNNDQFERAIEIYSRILELEPRDFVKSVIYKHRGMARFAQSLYEAAVEDFSKRWSWILHATKRSIIALSSNQCNKNTMRRLRTLRCPLRSIPISTLPCIGAPKPITTSATTRKPLPTAKCPRRGSRIKVRPKVS